MSHVQTMGTMLLHLTVLITGIGDSHLETPVCAVRSVMVPADHQDILQGLPFVTAQILM